MLMTRQRSGRRQALIRLLITLVRNLLAIKDPYVQMSDRADMLKYMNMQVRNTNQAKTSLPSPFCLSNDATD